MKENESLNSLLAQGNAVLDLFHFDADEAHGVEEARAQISGLEEEMQHPPMVVASMFIIYYLLSLLYGDPSDHSRGPVPEASTGVHLGRSDGTFYLLASSLKYSMSQPGNRQKKFS